MQETRSPAYRKEFLPVLKTDYPYQIDTPPVGILSKYPIVSSEILHLANHPETQQRAIVNFNQQEIVIYNMASNRAVG